MTKMKTSSPRKITQMCKNRSFAHNYNPIFLLRKCLYICFEIVHPHIEAKLRCFIINCLENIRFVTIDPLYLSLVYPTY